MLGIYFIPNVLEVHKIEVGCACPQGCVSLLHDVHMLCLTKPRIVWKAYLPPFRYILLVSTEYRDVGVNNVMLCTPCFSLKKINKEGAFQYTQFSGYWCICTVFTYNICLILAHCKMYSILLVTIFIVFFFGSCHELWLCKTKARLPTDNNSFGKKLVMHDLKWGQCTDSRDSPTCLTVICSCAGNPLVFQWHKFKPAVPLVYYAKCSKHHT